MLRSHPSCLRDFVVQLFSVADFNIFFLTASERDVWFPLPSAESMKLFAADGVYWIVENRSVPMTLRTKQPAFHRGLGRRFGWYSSCAPFMASQKRLATLPANDVSGIGRRESASGPPG